MIKLVLKACLLFLLSAGASIGHGFRIPTLVEVYEAAFCAELLRIEPELISSDEADYIRQTATVIISQGYNLDFVPLGITDARRMILEASKGVEKNKPLRSRLIECTSNLDRGILWSMIVRVPQNTIFGYGKQIYDFLEQLGLKDNLP
jgi:hypothetical protein